MDVVPIQPEPNRVYSVDAYWRGERYALQVSFLPGFCKHLERAEASVDLHRGELVFRDGRRVDVLGARAPFEHFVRAEAPPWLFRLPKPPRAFVLARGALRLDCDPETGKVAIELPDQCTPVFSCFEGPFLPPPPPVPDAAFEPLGSWQPVRLKLASSVSVRAPNADDAKTVQRLLYEVCGERGARWLAARPGVAHDVIFLVSPRGKHFSTLPELDAIRARLRYASAAPDQYGVSFGSDAQLTAATLLTKHARYVCLTADDLHGDCLSARHEIYHLLEAEMLGAEDHRLLDQWHGETVERGGPFARPYGFLRREFLPTLGELLDGAGGDDGWRWLREHHGPWTRWVLDVTGRTL